MTATKFTAVSIQSIAEGPYHSPHWTHKVCLQVIMFFWYRSEQTFNFQQSRVEWITIIVLLLRLKCSLVALWSLIAQECGNNQINGMNEFWCEFKVLYYVLCVFDVVPLLYLDARHILVFSSHSLKFTVDVVHYGFGLD